MAKVITLLFCQILLLSSLTAQNCTYEKYYYWCGSAAIDQAANDFKEARRKFKIAFSQTNFPLAMDLNLALKVAKETQDSAWAASIAITLAKGGMPLTHFKDFENDQWYKAFKAQFAEYSDSYKQNFDLELRNKLIALSLKDSLANNKYHRWRKGEIEMSLEELIANASGILEDLKSMIAAHGFPCEQSMGYYYGKGKSASFMIVILLTHIYQGGELFYRDRLSNIVCDGKLRPTDQAVLNGVRGFGDSTGIEQEMKIRYEKYRPRK